MAEKVRERERERVSSVFVVIIVAQIRTGARLDRSVLLMCMCTRCRCMWRAAPEADCGSPPRTTPLLAEELLSRILVQLRRKVGVVRS